ncbi:MAG: alpha-amylase family glycosyl hydrolase [Phycisphaerales bacterium]
MWTKRQGDRQKLPIQPDGDFTRSFLPRQQGLLMRCHSYSFTKRVLILWLVCGYTNPATAHALGMLETQPKLVTDESLRFGPDWARGIVWYQIFPERFADGNPLNNPSQRQSTTVPWSHPFDQSTIEEIERSWFLAAGEPRFFGYDPHREGGAITNVIFKRRYGGDLQGVLERLDALVALGIRGIYLCPVFTSTSLHKYDAADHRHIDPTLGHPGRPALQTMEMVHASDDETRWELTESDRWFVDVLIPAVHDRGMRLMLDGVWNHVGVDHWAFQDVLEKGRSSEFADWFEVRFDDEGQLVWWKSWNGENGRLPVFLQTEDGDLAPGPKAHIMAVTRRWMDPNNDGDPSDGIDGWRLDVANEVGRPFWKDWRTLVKDLNPEALIVGEIWHDASAYFDGTAFDAQMNYPAAYPIADWLSIGHVKGDTKSLAARLTEVYSNHRLTNAIQLNLLNSHDTERIVSLMHNDHQRSYDNGAHPWQDAHTYERAFADDDALVRSLVAYMMLVANPGSPMVYYGDEFAMVGADDPDDRHPIPSGYWDPDQLDTRQLWYQDQLRWILGLLSDPLCERLLRFGDASWESSECSSIIQINRRYQSHSLTIAIGPVESDWDSLGFDNREQLWDKVLQFGDSEAWVVRIYR